MTMMRNLKSAVLLVVLTASADASARWLSPEPMLQHPEFQRAAAIQGQAAPAYSYAKNNPLMYTDPTGLWPIGSDDFSICYSNCLDERGRVSQYLIPMSPIPKALVPPYREIGDPFTSVPSLIAHYLGGRASVAGSALRSAGRAAAWLRYPLLGVGYANVAICAAKCHEEESVTVCR